MPKSTRTFLLKKSEFIRSMGKQHGETDPFCYHVNLIHRQLEGLLDCYNSVDDQTKKLY